MSTYRYNFQIVETGEPRVARLIRAAAETLGITVHEFAKRATISVAAAMAEDAVGSLPKEVSDGESID